MEQDNWLLVFKCHDAFETEYLGEGLKTVQFHLKETYLHNAKMEALNIWTKIMTGEVNPPKERETKDDRYSDWGHYDPYLVSKNNPKRKEKLI